MLKKSLTQREKKAEEKLAKENEILRIMSEKIKADYDAEQVKQAAKEKAEVEIAAIKNRITKSDELFVGNWAEPEKVLGFVPSIDSFSEYAIETLKALKLSKIHYTPAKYLLGLTFEFNDGTLSPPAGTFNHKQTDVLVYSQEGKSNFKFGLSKDPVLINLKISDKDGQHETNPSKMNVVVPVTHFKEIEVSEAQRIASISVDTYSLFVVKIQFLMFNVNTLKL